MKPLAAIRFEAVEAYIYNFMIRTVFDRSKKPGYRSQAEDTSIEADILEFSLLRSRTPMQRYKMAIALMKRSRQLSLQSLKQRFSD